MNRFLAVAAFSVVLPAVCLGQPLNNSCQTAQPVVEQLYDFDMTDGGNTVSSTCDPAGVTPPEVWFDYTPAATGTATVSTCGLAPYVPHLPVTLTVFAQCGGPQVACAAANCVDGQSELSFPVVGGEHYLIRVASATAEFATGGIIFRVIGVCAAPAPGAPSNDCCATATAITTGFWPFTTVSATRDYWSTYDINVFDNPDVWFNFTAATTGFVKIRPATDAPADLAVAVLDGSCAGGEIACDCDGLVGIGVRQLTVPTVAGHHYLIRLRGISYDPDQATVSGHFSVAVATPPANDDCSHAINITGVGVFDYDNTVANNSGPDNQLICDSYLGGAGIFQDVWFRWTSNLPAGQDAVISTVESPQIETKIAVYNDNCIAGVNGGALDCNDRVSDLLAQSRVSFTPTPGAAYLIRVGTRPNIENQLPPQGRPGFFTISSQPTCIISAPPGAFIEPEACGQDTNGGCDTNQFTDIPCGTTTIFGTAPVINGVPDRDFYRVTLPVATHVTFGGTGEVPLRLVIVNSDCEFIAGSPFPFGTCESANEPLEADLRPGTYAFAVQSARPDSPCDRKNNYVVTISVGACEPTGRCCIHGGCSVLLHSACVSAGGAYGGDYTVCPPPGGNYVPSSCADGLEDISSFGTAGPACNDCGVVAALGFGFSLYGHSYTSVHISSNGFLTFSDETYDGAVPPPDRLPNPYDLAVIAPCWGDLDSSAGGEVFTAALGTAPNRRFVAMWSNIQTLGVDGSASTFEAVLYEGSNQIAFRYGSIDPSLTPLVAVTNADGTLAGVFNAPDPESCTTLVLTREDNPCCQVDFDLSGTVSVQDIFDFLNAWFAGDQRADFNHSGAITVADIFDFLNAWFAGCP